MKNKTKILTTCILLFALSGEIWSQSFETYIEYSLENSTSESFETTYERGLKPNHSFTSLVKYDPWKLICENRTMCITEILIADVLDGSKGVISLATGMKLEIDSIKKLLYDEVVNEMHFDTGYVLRIEGIESYLIHQKWNYNSGNELTTQVLGLIPVKHGRSSENQLLFYIPMNNDSAPAFSINNDAIAWVKQTQDKVSIDSIFKDKTILRAIIDSDPQNKCTYHYLGALMNLNKPFRINDNLPVDDNMDRIIGLQFDQFFYYDAKARSLNAKINAIAPIEEVRDDHGDLLFYDGRYWIILEDGTKSD